MSKIDCCAVLSRRKNPWWRLFKDIKVWRIRKTWFDVCCHFGLKRRQANALMSNFCRRFLLVLFFGSRNGSDSQNGGFENFYLLIEKKFFFQVIALKLFCLTPKNPKRLETVANILLRLENFHGRQFWWQSSSIKAMIWRRCNKAHCGKKQQQSLEPNNSQKLHYVLFTVGQEKGYRRS